MAKKKLKGKQAFIEYYQSIFPDPQEFEAFIASLERRSEPVLRFFPKDEERLKALWKDAGIEWKTLDWYQYALLWPEGFQSGAEIPGFEERLFYIMNAASLLPVLALDVQPDDMVLDSCAAPGGKTLFISQFIGEDGHLVGNDVTRRRRKKLEGVMEEYGVDHVEVWGKRAEILFKNYPNYFDRILVDAPCSAARHVFRNPRYLKDQWIYSRLRELRQIQISLVSGLFLALKPGGRMVYSTCSVTPDEDEFVVGTLLKKKKDAIRLCDWPLPEVPGGPGMEGEYPAEFDLNAVRRVMPHKHGLDPMFVAVFEKLA